MTINDFPILIHEPDQPGVPLIQGTPQWLEWRRGGIGGSTVAAVMCVSDWETPQEAWKRAKGLLPPFDQTPAMARGHQLEPYARTEFGLETGLYVEPKCFQHPRHDWIRVSLDGVTEDHRIAVEIKCPGTYKHTEALKGRVPKQFRPQLQYQMYALGLERMYYYSWMPELGGKLIEVDRDEDYIERMLPRVTLFWNLLRDGVEPHEEQFVGGDAGGDTDRCDPAWRRAAEQWKLAHGLLKDAQLQAQQAESVISALMQRKRHGVAAGAGIHAERMVGENGIVSLSITLSDEDCETKEA